MLMFSRLVYCAIMLTYCAIMLTLAQHLKYNQYNTFVLIVCGCSRALLALSFTGLWFNVNVLSLSRR